MYHLTFYVSECHGEVMVLGDALNNRTVWEIRQLAELVAHVKSTTGHSLIYHTYRGGCESQTGME